MRHPAADWTGACGFLQTEMSLPACHASVRGGEQQIYVGVDPHTKSHLLVGIDDHGQTCGTRSVINRPQGWGIALRWVRDHDDACCWGIENSGSLGKGFAQFLRTHGETDV